MIGDTAVVVDSACYLPAALIERYGLFVVPLSVVLDGEEFLETEIQPDEFYDRLSRARSVSTSQPSVGRLIECYERAAQAGARRIVSIHIGSNVSGTVQAARLAAESAPVPVQVVDTRQASFAEGLCVLEGVEALEEGASPEEAALRCETASAAVGNTFIVKALDLMRRGGRLAVGATATVTGIPVMAFTAKGARVVGSASTLEEAVELMAAQVGAAAGAGGGRRLRVGVGHGAATEVASALHARLLDVPGIDEIIDYVVGPAVGAHVGAGNAGAVFLPRPVRV